MDVAFDSDPPALAVLHADYRAIYASDAQLTLAWGIDEEDWREAGGGRQMSEEKPEWAADTVWTSVHPHWAQIRFSGTAIWQVKYASIDWGSGVSGVLPWPSPRFSEERKLGSAPKIVGWGTTRWHVEFARLLNELQRNNDFDFDAELDQIGMLARDISPIDVQRDWLG